MKKCKPDAEMLRCYGSVQNQFDMTGNSPYSASLALQLAGQISVWLDREGAAGGECIAPPYLFTWMGSSSMEPV